MNKIALDKITQPVGVGTISNRLRATSNVPLNKNLGVLQKNNKTNKIIDKKIEFKIE